MNSKPSFKPESIDSLLEKAESGENLIGQERNILRTYLHNTLSGAGNSPLRPIVEVRANRIRHTLDLRLPAIKQGVDRDEIWQFFVNGNEFEGSDETSPHIFPEKTSDEIMESFRRVDHESPISADIFRFSSFLDPANIPFEIILAGAKLNEINPKLSQLVL